MARALSLRRVGRPVRSCILFCFSPDCVRRHVALPDAVGLPCLADLTALPGLVCAPRPPQAVLSG